MIKNRLIKYVFLLIGSFMIPYFISHLINMITEYRLNGLYYSILPSIILVHFIFAITQINKKLHLKALIAVAGIILTCFITYIPIYFDILLKIDKHGFYDAMVFFALGTISSWEILFQIDKRVNSLKLKV